MTVNLPLVVVLGVATWAAIKFLRIRLWVVAVIALFGFYLAHTLLAPAIDNSTRHSVRIINGTHT